MITQAQLDYMKDFIDDGLCPICTNKGPVVNINIEGPYFNKVPVCLDCYDKINNTYEECPSCGVLINPDNIDPWEGDVYSEALSAYNCTECSDKITFRKENY